MDIACMSFDFQKLALGGVHRYLMACLVWSRDWVGVEFLSILSSAWHWDLMFIVSFFLFTCVLVRVIGFLSNSIV